MKKIILIGIICLIIGLALTYFLFTIYNKDITMCAQNNDNICEGLSSGDEVYSCEGEECEITIYDIIYEEAESSNCTEYGTLIEDTISYNNYTKTWWIDLTPFEEHSGCNPACVLNEDLTTTEVNWRCTGLIV